MNKSIITVVAETTLAVIAIVSTTLLAGWSERSRRRLRWFLAGFSGGMVGYSLLT